MPNGGPYPPEIGLGERGVKPRINWSAIIVQTVIQTLLVLGVAWGYTLSQEHRITNLEAAVVQLTNVVYDLKEADKANREAITKLIDNQAVVLSNQAELTTLVEVTTGYRSKTKKKLVPDR